MQGTHVEVDCASRVLVVQSHHALRSARSAGERRRSTGALAALATAQHSTHANKASMEAGPPHLYQLQAAGAGSKGGK